MPLGKDKQSKRDPTYRDEQAIEAINMRLTDLENTIRAYAGTGQEVKDILRTIRSATAQAVNVILK